MTEEAKRPSVDEVAASMTGFDEIAIEEYFRKDVTKLSGTLQMRAMVFLLRRREGMADSDAFRSVMNLPFVDIDTEFDDGGEDGEEPGKEPSSTSPGPTSSSTPA